MADIADDSDERIQLALEQAISQARSAPALRPKRHCHYCDEAIGNDLLFCNKACSEDFEEEESQLKRMGRR